MSDGPVTEQPLKGSTPLSPGYGGVAESLPPSLQQLAKAGELMVKQHIDPVEVVLCCFARPCRYSVYVNGSEDQLLYVQEVSECYARQVMGAARGFALKFSDNEMMDLVRLERPQTCSRGCCGVCCTLPTLKVQTPPGTTVATVTERRTCCYPVYDIMDTTNQLRLSLATSCCYSSILSILSDIIVDVHNTDGNLVAQVVKQTKMNGHEYLDQHNNFTIKYLTDMPVTDKVAIVGAMFLIDFHYFERQNRCCC